MDSQKPKPNPHRENTDESLKKERDKSDNEVEQRMGRAAGVAAEVIEQARGDADDVLRAARLAEGPQPGGARLQTRHDEDVSIERHREAADQKIEVERRERTQALAALFAFERELTDQYLLAERNRADRALNNRDDFLGMVAHDLRGFMGEIALRTALLGKTPGDDERSVRTRELSLGIQRSTAGMRRLVGDLLDCASIEAGRLHVQAVRGDLVSVVRDASEPFAAAAEGKGLSLALEEPADPVFAMFDHDRVIQVLGNLVSNAIKFTPRGGTIALSVGVSAGEALVRVKDSGAGIPPDMLENVFVRFTQLLPSDRRGLGLGLYIAKCLIEEQQGRIWAARAHGSGTVFSFTLPLAR